MKRLLQRWLRKPSGKTAPAETPPAPDVPLYVIGDVHGRHDLLMRLVERLAAGGPIGGDYRDARVVLVGDYIDRGEHSEAVLRTLRAAARTFPDRIICLRGNHEQLMLDFLQDPERAGPYWFRHGGLQTLASFGVGGVTETSAGPALAETRDVLRERLAPDLEAWLNRLPLLHLAGNVAVCHAGTDPDVPIDAQLDADLLWGNARSLRPRRDGYWVCHGHYVTDAPIIEGQRISIDTGAYESGVLTSACLMPDGEVWFATS